MVGEPVPAGRDPDMHQLVIDGMRSQIDELEAELVAYGRLAAGEVTVPLLELDILGDRLIQIRIASGLSQRQLDRAAGLAKGTIRRYERDGYRTAPLHRLQLVQNSLAECGTRQQELAASMPKP